MLRIAAGEGLPFAQDALSCRGHAVEARLCAEDADNNFMPSTGDLVYVQFPASDVRVETGIETGSIVTPNYDSMLAKLIAYAPARDDALDKLGKALDETSIFGLTTNQAFLKSMIELPATRAATFYTSLIDEQLGSLTEARSLDAEALAIGACFWLMQQRPENSRDPWQTRKMTAWLMTGDDAGLSPIPILHLESRGTSAEIRFSPLRSDGSMLIGVNEAQIPVKLVHQYGRLFTAIIGARLRTVRIVGPAERIYVQEANVTHAMTAVPYLTYVSASAQTSTELRAPMTGTVLKVNVAEGDSIKAGDAAVIMESMKMELRIASEIDGIVAAVRCQPGETVDRNAIVAIVEPAAPAG
jgi:3-methylcrotonyl-CoA carboxylase alpha subunit